MSGRMEGGRGGRGGSGGGGGGGYRGGRGGGGGGGGRGGGRGGYQQQQQRRDGPTDKPKKENILDLAKYSNKRIIVQYQGGRQVVGTLKGFDPLQNLVLDNTEETLRDINDPSRLTTSTRPLGLVVVRGTAITLVSPYDGTEEIGRSVRRCRAGRRARLCAG
ncbi:hypothetical protein BC831DRAFT_410514 [Entophlyctis helioformis]|nr:hypothetical protein BC831DRAFT_410514 [Entophlyctis helioformis]